MRQSDRGETQWRMRKKEERPYSVQRRDKDMNTVLETEGKDRAETQK